VVDARPDDAERHGDRGDVGDDPPRAAPGHPAALADDDREDDTGDDRQRVRPQRHRAEVPDALRGARQVREDGRHRSSLGRDGGPHSLGELGRQPPYAVDAAVLQRADEGRADDDAVGEGRDLRGLRAGADAEPDGDGQRGLRADALDERAAPAPSSARAPVTPMTAAA
jgi:hypothetical protein